MILFTAWRQKQVGVDSSKFCQKKKEKEQVYQMDYAFCFMMMVTTCIVHSVLQCSLKAAVRRFTRRGMISAVENDDHSNIIEGKSLSKQCFSFKHARKKA